MTQDFVKKVFDKIEEYKEWNNRVSTKKLDLELLEERYNEKSGMYESLDSVRLSRISELENQIDELESKSDKAKNELNSSIEKKLESEAEIASNEKKISELKDKLSLLEDDFRNTSKRLEGEIKEISKKIDSGNEELYELGEEVVAFKSFKKSLDGECRGLIHKNSEIIEQNTIMMRKMSDAQILIDRAKKIYKDLGKEINL